MDPAIGEAGDIDTSLAMLTFENGVVVTVDNSRKATYGYDQRVEVFGSKVRCARCFERGLSRPWPSFDEKLLELLSLNACGVTRKIGQHAR